MDYTKIIAPDLFAEIGIKTNLDSGIKKEAVTVDYAWERPKIRENEFNPTKFQIPMNPT